MRSAPLAQGGEIVCLDWDRKRILARSPIDPTSVIAVGPNPRGNARGGRGVAIFGNILVVAAYHALKVYDLDLNHLRDLSHGLMAGLHEVYPASRDTLWTCATAIDAALAYSIVDGRLLGQFWPRQCPVLRERLGLVPRPLDPSGDYRRSLDGTHRRDNSHLHLNAVACWRGELHALFSEHGVVANLDNGTVALRRPHNRLFLDDGSIVLNNSLERKIQFYSPGSNRPDRVIELERFPEVKTLSRMLTFRRALRSLATGAAGVGVSRVVHRYLCVVLRLRVKSFLSVSPLRLSCVLIANGGIAGYVLLQR